MSDILQAFFTDQILEPWKEACTNAPFPWEATPELRRQWLALARSPGKHVALSGALALARCSRLTSEEKEAVNRLFLDIPQEILPEEVILQILLTGGSPPSILYDTIFSPLMNSGELPPDGYWTFFGHFVRHPIYVEQSETVLQLEQCPLPLYYNAFINPARKAAPITPEQEANILWLKAAHIFHSSSARVQLSSLKTDLERFALLMRCDFTIADFLGISSSFTLDEPFIFAQTDHPCQFSGPAPIYEHDNPSLEAIRYFSGTDSVSALYRFYNPLLNFPWEMEDILTSDHHGILMGLLLMGYMPHHITAHRVIDYPNLVSAIQQHPAFIWDMLVQMIQRRDSTTKAEDTESTPSELNDQPQP